MLSKCCPQTSDEQVMSVGKMSSRITDGLLLTGAYTLIATVVFLQRCGLLMTFTYYPMLCITVILATSITCSMFSRQMSLDMTSAIFTVLWLPLSVVLKSTGSPSDHLTDTVRYHPTDPLVPFWIRQSVFHFLLYRFTDEAPNFGWITWIITFNLVLHLLEVLSTRFTLRESPEMAISDIFPPNLYSLFLETLALLTLGIYSYNTVHTVTLLLSTCYCVITSTQTKDLIVKDLGDKITDAFDGLEKEYMEALVLILDISANLIMLVLGLGSGDILGVTLPCVSMYYPLRDVRARVWNRIQSERAALTPFPRAGISTLLRHDDVCPVCLCPMKAARVTPCGHMFHSRCLRLCLKEKPACPLCIQSISVST